MDYWAFSMISPIITSAFENLAWPTTALIVLYVFHEEIKKLITRIRKGKIGNAELEFAAALQEIEAETDIGEPQQINEEVLFYRSNEALDDPRGAILSSWIAVEKALLDLVKARDLEYRPKSTRGITIRMKGGAPGVSAAIRAIQQSEVVDPDVITLIHELRVLRNQAAHDMDFNPDPASVIKYSWLTKKLVNELRNAQQPQEE